MNQHNRLVSTQYDRKESVPDPGTNPPGWKVKTPLTPHPPWVKDMKQTNAPFRSEGTETPNWSQRMKAARWERIEQVWHDFLDCDYEERCDVLFSLMEEILNEPSDIVSTMAECPEKGPNV
jgi:hypothetical protein